MGAVQRMQTETGNVDHINNISANWLFGFYIWLDQNSHKGLQI